MYNRNKVTGTILGVAIGDCLGLPVETFSRGRIKKEYGFVKDYLIPDKNPYFKAQPAGTYSDDTQLTLAVLNALMGDKNMEAMAEQHVLAMNKTTNGWGNSTRDSVEKLADGTLWTNSATGTGLGNGVAMKVAPIGLWRAIFKHQYEDVSKFNQQIDDLLIELAGMTHKTDLAVASGFIHSEAIHYLYESSPESFDSKTFLDRISAAAKIQDNLPKEYVKVPDRFSEIINQLNPSLTDKEIDELFGYGSCYCYHSIPFSYAYFLRNPTSIDSLFDAVNAGGDADSNAAIVGSMLGALNGKDIFPSYLIDGLQEKDNLLKSINDFNQFLIYETDYR